MKLLDRFFGPSHAEVGLSRIGFVVVALILLLVLPFTLNVFRLGLAAKYLSLAFSAIGIVLIWGYGGILSLGQGFFLRPGQLHARDVPQARGNKFG